MKNKTNLSERELDVLQWIAKGRTNAQIAYKLGIGHETIKTYVNRLRAKLGINTRLELSKYWEKNFNDLGAVKNHQ